MTFTITLNAVDDKGVKTSVPIDDAGTSKNFNRHTIGKNTLGIVGTLYTPKVNGHTTKTKK